MTDILSEQSLISVITITAAPATENECLHDPYAENTTGVHLINHIDEGLWILKQIGASEYAQRAFAIHPLVQDDNALKQFASSELAQSVDPYVLMLAMEYRWVANSYLSFHASRPIDQIQLSPLLEVNQMLIADKVQNRKDFEIHHLGTHPNSDRLREYFGEWLSRLDVPETQYQTWVAHIKQATGQ